MNNDELVSVIIPVYNVEEYIEKCLNSVVNQTYKKIEIIIIDDGTQDGAGKICDDYAKKDNRIKVIHQNNRGLSAARNVGIDKAKGKYIAFIDSDDYVNEKYIELLLADIVENNADISVCGYNDVTPAKKLRTGEESCCYLLSKQLDLDIVAWNKIYRRDLFIENDIRYPEGRLHEDNLTTYKLYSRARKVSYISESLYNYVIREGSITTSDKKRTRQLIEKEKAAKEAALYLDNSSEKLKNAASYSLLLSWFRFIDCSLANMIDVSYYERYRKLVLSKSNIYKKNLFLTKKMRGYLFLLKPFGGLPYKIFRKIKK